MNKSRVLGIDTTFKLCNMWITDTSYCNKRLVSSRTRKNPVHLGAVMMHFSKDEGTFRRFCVELISANPSADQSEESWGGHGGFNFQWIPERH